jgi:propionyl-CoA carboxylase alpha chain
MQHTTSPSKVIEEAPSSVLTPELRKKMGEAAVLVAKSCDYLAGTVSFIRRKKISFPRNEYA